MNLNLIEQVGRQNLHHVVPDVNGHVFSCADIEKTEKEVIKVEEMKRKNSPQRSQQGSLTSQRLQSMGRPYPGFCGPVVSL